MSPGFCIRHSEGRPTSFPVGARFFGKRRTSRQQLVFIFFNVLFSSSMDRWLSPGCGPRMRETWSIGAVTGAKNHQRPEQMVKNVRSGSRCTRGTIWLRHFPPRPNFTAYMILAGFWVWGFSVVLRNVNPMGFLGVQTTA